MPIEDVSKSRRAKPGQALSDYLRDLVVEIETPDCAESPELRVPGEAESPASVAPWPPRHVGSSDDTSEGFGGLESPEPASPRQVDEVSIWGDAESPEPPCTPGPLIFDAVSKALDNAQPLGRPPSHWKQSTADLAGSQPKFEEDRTLFHEPEADDAVGSYGKNFQEQRSMGALDSPTCPDFNAQKQPSGENQGPGILPSFEPEVKEITQPQNDLIAADSKSSHLPGTPISVPTAVSALYQGGPGQKSDLENGAIRQNAPSNSNAANSEQEDSNGMNTEEPPMIPLSVVPALYTEGPSWPSDSNAMALGQDQQLEPPMCALTAVPALACEGPSRQPNVEMAATLRTWPGDFIAADSDQMEKRSQREGASAIAHNSPEVQEKEVNQNEKKKNDEREEQQEKEEEEEELFTASRLVQDTRVRYRKAEDTSDRCLANSPEETCSDVARDSESEECVEVAENLSSELCLTAGTKLLQHEAAISIQSCQRGRLARHQTEMFKHQRDIDEQNRAETEAALRIQSCHRGRHVRVDMARRREAQRQEDERTKELDAEVKRMQHYNETLAAVKIQSNFRGLQARHEARLAFERKRQEEEQEEEEEEEERRERAAQEEAWMLLAQGHREAEAAITIQRWYRGSLARQHFVALRSTKTCDEAVIAALAMHEREHCAIMIQKQWRGVMARHRVREVRHAEREAALRIQSCHRGRSARANLVRQRERREREAQARVKEESALRLQSSMRGHLARNHMKVLEAQRDLKTQAAVRIQSRFRGHLAREEARALLEAQYEREYIEAQRSEEAAVAIQRLQRGRLARREIGLIKMQRETAIQAVVKIQKWHRGNLARRDAICTRIIANYASSSCHGAIEVATSQHIMTWAAKAIQSYWRTRKQRRETDAAAIRIQRHHRGQIARRRMEALRLQQNLETRVARRDAICTRMIADYASSSCHGAIEVAMSQHIMTWAAKGIQSYWRTRKQRRETDAAAIRIQRLHRGQIARRRTEALRLQQNLETRAALVIQSSFRGHQGRVDACSLREAHAKAMQQHLDEVALAIQSLQRGRLARQQVETLKVQRCKETHAAVKIQSRFRGQRARVEFRGLRRTMSHVFAGDEVEHSIAQRLEEAALAIQRTMEYSIAQRLEEAALAIQRIQRGRLARREIGSLKLQRDIESRAAVRIQSGFRSQLARSEVHELRETKREEEYLEAQRLEAAALAIQSLHRGRLARRQTENFRLRAEAETQAAVMIQSGYRGQLARGEVRALRQREYMEAHRLEEAAVAIQSLQRGWVARQHAECLRLQKSVEDAAAVKIQSSFRGQQARRAANDKKSQAEAVTAQWLVDRVVVRAASIASKRQAAAMRRAAATVCHMAILRVLMCDEGKDEEVEESKINMETTQALQDPLTARLRQWADATVLPRPPFEPPPSRPGPQRPKRWQRQVHGVMTAAAREREAREETVAVLLQSHYRAWRAREAYAAMLVEHRPKLPVSKARPEPSRNTTMEKSQSALLSARLLEPREPGSGPVRTTLTYFTTAQEEIIATCVLAEDPGEKAPEPQLPPKLRRPAAGYAVGKHRCREEAHAELRVFGRPESQTASQADTGPDPSECIDSPNDFVPVPPSEARNRRAPRPFTRIRVAEQMVEPAPPEAQPWHPVRGDQSTASLTSTCSLEKPPAKATRRSLHRPTKPRRVIAFPVHEEVAADASSSDEPGLGLYSDEGSRLPRPPASVKPSSFVGAGNTPWPKAKQGTTRVPGYSKTWAAQNSVPCRYRFASAPPPRVHRSVADAIASPRSGGAAREGGTDSNELVPRTSTSLEDVGVPNAKTLAPAVSSDKVVYLPPLLPPHLQQVGFQWRHPRAPVASVLKSRPVVCHGR